MPYIGRELDSGNYLKLDDISSSFNGSLTTFNLTAGNKAFFPGSAFSILVVLAGVVQEPEAAYNINQSQITFASAPLAGDQFFCISLGVAHGINVPGNGTVNGAQLAKPFNYDGYFYLDDANNRVGVGTATPQKPLHVIGEGQFDSVRILGDLTIDGTTTTLDTVVTEVDKLEVGANNSTVGVAITQSGSGDILNLYDGSTEVFSVADGGDVSIVDKIIHTGDTNTAIRFPADDTVTVETAGTERLRVTSAGNVGIGTADPQRKLSIKDSGNTFISIENLSNVTSGLIGANSSGLTLISRDTQGGSTAKPIQFITGSTEKVRISSTGLVGIGTADPQSQFEVFGSSPVVRSKNTTNQTYTEISNDGTDGYVDWSSGDLVFRSASNTERLRIKTGGNIGIGGTSAPRAKFDFGSGTGHGILNQTLANYQAVFESPQGTGNISRNIGFAVGTNGIGAAINAVDNGGTDATGLIFATGTAGSIAERLRISHDGKVGIGTDNPQQQLEVHGDSGGTIRLAKGGASRTNILAGDTLGKIEFRSYDGSMNHNAFNATYAQIETVAVDALGGNPGENVRLDFKIADSDEPASGKAVTPVPALSILQGGNVGIGTDNPSKKLHVDGTIFASGSTTSLDGGVRIKPNNDGTNYGGVIYGGAHNDNNTAIHLRRGVDGGNNTIDINSYGMFRVFTNGALASQTEKLRITSDGYARLTTANARLEWTASSGSNPFIRSIGSGQQELEFNTGGTERLRITSDGKIGINEATPTVSVDLSSNTDAVSLPTGTTAQRPAGTDAYIRKNSTNNALEFYNGTNWVEIITDYFPTGSTTLG